MVQRCEHFGFTLEPREPIMISSQRRRENLDGDLAFEPGVGGPEHPSHSAFADLRGDFVDAEACAGREGQRLRWNYTGCASLPKDAAAR